MEAIQARAIPNSNKDTNYYGCRCEVHILQPDSMDYWIYGVSSTYETIGNMSGLIPDDIVYAIFNHRRHMIYIGSSCVGVKLDNDTIHVDWNPIKRPILSHKRGLNMGKHEYCRNIIMKISSILKYISLRYIHHSSLCRRGSM